ncbi:hypothetical protein MKX01_008971 [Papaver californicum]|nr:hypothetical protein MKX01_008971 [Papaver californicum]
MAGQKDKTTRIGGFSVLNKYAALYKTVYERHGHIATNIVIKDLMMALFALVADLLGVINQTMETSFANLGEPLLKHWDSKVTAAEAVKFNVSWLRKRVNELMTEFASAQIFQSVSDKDEEERLKACKTKVQANAAEKKRKASQSVLNELL